VTCGLILAAGESRRMGSPKALLKFQGETGFRRVAEALIVENPDFRLGQLSSMQCGLRAVPADADSVLFTLVDHPAVMPATLYALLDADVQAPLRIPRFEGRRGHPIRISKSLIPEFLALPAGSSAREVVTRHAAEIAYIDVDDPGILANVDDQPGYARLLAGVPL
jgi:molybdenum cofactor cytidylyltransferase